MRRRGRLQAFLVGGDERVDLLAFGARHQVLVGVDGRARVLAQVLPVELAGEVHEGRDALRGMREDRLQVDGEDAERVEQLAADLVQPLGVAPACLASSQGLLRSAYWFTTSASRMISRTALPYSRAS